MVIHGPATIGDNVAINAGAVIENCIIGDNVNTSGLPAHALGGGSTFTDFNLLPSPLRALNGEGELSLANRPV